MILCVGLTPTVQRTLRFARLSVGEVNRAREVHVTASGKGLNVARVVTLLGGESLLVQFLSGDTGRFIARTLDCERIASATIWTEDDAPTRTCITLLSDDETPPTELVEEARAVSKGEIAALEATVRRHLPEARALGLSGSFPPGVPDDLYARLIEAAHAADVPTVVDAQRAPLRAALAARPLLVKPNREEATATLGFPLTGDAEADARTATDALVGAGAAWALVSMGAPGSLLREGATGRLWRVEPPRVKAVNAIGSGDSLAAGLLHALAEGSTVPEAALFGTACAAANCLTLTSGVIHPEDVTDLRPQARLIPLDGEER